MDQLWNDLSALFTLYKDHRPKTGPLTITKAMDPFTVKWRGATAPTIEAIFYTVENSDNNTTHHVGLAVDPSSGFLTMWCGDKTYADSQGVKDATCNFWREKGSKGKYLCKHCWHVLNHERLMDDERQRQKAEEKLGLGHAKPSAANSHGKLNLIIKHWRSAHIFGPTGSGKTHDVLEMLNANSKDLTVIPIFITSGLQDTDLLMKLIPDPMTGTQAKDALAQIATGSESLRGMFANVTRILAMFLPNIGKSGWIRLPGELLTAFTTALNGKNKVVVLLEELTRSNESLRRMLVKVMDNQGGKYTLHDFTSGQMITVPEKKLIFVATSNFGYEDTSPIDPALARRFPLTFFYDYSEQKEKEILGKILPAAQVKKIQKIAAKIRNQYRSGRLPKPLDTGSLIEWAKLVNEGETLQEAAHATWINRIVDTDQMGYPERGQVDAIIEEINNTAGT